MDAWQKVCHQTTGPVRLLIPEGRFLISSMYFSGPCTCQTPVTIQVKGYVMATTDISEYENGDWLMFEKLNGLKIIGGGTFDGQGKKSWEYSENCESGDDRACARNPSVSTNTFHRHVLVVMIYFLLIKLVCLCMGECRAFSSAIAATWLYRASGLLIPKAFTYSLPNVQT